MTTVKGITGNKGEWSEFYTFCYLLNTGVLKTADKDLIPSNDMYLPIVRIIRKDNNQELSYYPEKNSENIGFKSGEMNLDNFKKSEFKETLNIIYNKFQTAGGEGAFEIPEVAPFMNKIKCSKLKADPVHKEDIRIQVQDINTGQSPIQGFSIKSYMGNDPTLLNAGKTTNFRFLVDGCSNELMEQINRIETRTKIVDRMNKLIEVCELQYDSMSNKQFEKNLQMVDSLMPRIMAELLFIHYTEGIVKLSDAVVKLEMKDPLKMNNPGFYEYKVKSMLRAVALGMIPSEPWKGREDANGGYIVVKDDGDVVCFFLYNRNEFEQYLFDCTKFERGSTTRHDYMRIVKEGNEYYLNLNLQIRFIKPGVKPRNNSSALKQKTLVIDY